MHPKKKPLGLWQRRLYCALGKSVQRRYHAVISKWSGYEVSWL